MSINHTAKSLTSLKVDNHKQLVWLVYGKQQEYIDEAIFSILSAIYHSEESRPVLRVITDTPESFQGLPVELDIINQDTLKTWYGPDNYNHRAKPCSLLSVLSKAEKTILIDTDTFFKKNPHELFDLIDSTTVLVDTIHEKWRESKDNSFHESCGDLLEKKYGVTEALRHVNSGLIGISGENGTRIIKKMIEVIDDMYVMSGRTFNVEQFAFGVACQNLNIPITKHDATIQHYWSRKALHRVIIQVWLKKFAGRYFSEDAITEFNSLNITPPRPNTFWRLLYKLKALRVKKELRQFCIEVNRACHDYNNDYWREAQAGIIQKTLVNLQKKYPDIYLEISNNPLPKQLKNALGATATHALEQHIISGKKAS